MPTLKWLPEALADVERLHRFLAQVSPSAAQRAAGTILDAANRHAVHPEIGKPLEDGRREWFAPFGAGAYVLPVLRYRIDTQGCPVVIRVWHSREDGTQFSCACSRNEE